MAATIAVLLAQQASNPIRPAVSTLTDDFATADTAKWAFAAAATVTGGQLSLGVNPGYSGAAGSVATYDLTGSSATVQLAQAANLGNGTTETVYYLYTTPGNVNDNAVFFDVTGSGTATMFLAAYRAVGGTRTLVASTGYDPAAHRWLRIRESAGTVYWDTSSDRVAWTNVGTWSPTFSITALYAQIGSGYYGTEPSPGTAVFDNFNVAPAEVHTTSGTATGTASAAGSTTTTRTKTATASATATATRTTSSTRTKTATATATATATRTGSSVRTKTATASATATATGTTAAVRTKTGTATATATAGAVTATTRPKTGTAQATAAASATAATSSTRLSLAAATAQALAAAATETARITLGEALAYAYATAVTVQVTGPPPPAPHTYATAAIAPHLSAGMLTAPSSTAALAPAPAAVATLVAPVATATLASPASAATLAGDGRSQATLTPAAAAAALHTTD